MLIPVFDIILNNWFIYLSLIYSSVAILLIWRVLRNSSALSKSGYNSYNEKINKLLIFSVIGLIINIKSILFTFFAKIFSSKEEFKKYYFEGKIVLIYLLII